MINSPPGTTPTPQSATSLLDQYSIGSSARRWEPYKMPDGSDVLIDTQAKPNDQVLYHLDGKTPVTPAEYTAMNTPINSAAGDYPVGNNLQPASATNPATMVMHANGTSTPIPGAATANRPVNSAASDVVMGENMQPAGPDNPARLIQHADGSVTSIAGSSSIHDTRYTGAQDITYDPQTGLPIVTQLTPGQMQPPRVEDYMTWTEQPDNTWAPAIGADGNPLTDWPSYIEALARSQLASSQAGAQNSDIGKNYDDLVPPCVLDFCRRAGRPVMKRQELDPYYWDWPRTPSP